MLRPRRRFSRRLPEQSTSSAVHLQAARPAGSRGFRDDTAKAGAKTVYFSVDEMSLIVRSVDGLSADDTSGWVTVTTHRHLSYD